MFSLKNKINKKVCLSHITVCDKVEGSLKMEQSVRWCEEDG